jgi:hypothetical protein
MIAVIVAATAGGITALRAATPAKASVPEGRPAGAALREEVEQLESYVATTRGLLFLEEVDVRVIAVADMTKALGAERELTKEESSQSQGQADALFALGIVDERYSADAARKGYAGGVTGFYDHESDRLVVPDVPLTPYRKQVLVHELVHAVDDQHHDLDHDPGRIVSEEDVAYLALVEGDARSIDQRYLEAMSPADRAAAEDEADKDPSAGAGDALPDSLLAMFSFPYEAGSAFVDDVREAGGNGAVDAAFDKPPVSSEQILQPDLYRAHQGVAVTSRPHPEGEVVHRDVIGELGLYLMVANVDEKAAAAAAAGWGGDRFVAWRQDGKVCVHDALRMDTPQDVDELLAALGPWRAAHPEATLERTGQATPIDELHIRSCVTAS